MKKFTKVFLLGALTIGMMTGCNFGKKSTPTSENSSDIGSSISSKLESSASLITSSTPTSSKNSTSSSKPVSSSMAVSSSSVAPTLTGITLNTTNVKKEYKTGDVLDLTGLVVTASYSNNTTAVVNDYTSNPANGSTLETVGEVTVTITYLTANEQFNIAVSKGKWTAEEAKTMSDNLHGIVLPYTGYAESVVSYDSEKKVVTVQGGKGEGNYVKTYAALLTNAGFEQLAATAEETAYDFRKSATTAEGTRYIEVIVAAMNDALYINAGDPYYYEFPVIFANYFANIIGTEVIPPALTGADFYEIALSESAIYCYTTSSEVYRGYDVTLRAEMWKVANEADAEGYTVAVAPDYSYQIRYAYDSAKGRFVIRFALVDTWQTQFFEDFFTELNITPFEVPAFEVEGTNYLFMKSGTNALIGLMGIKASDIQAYARKVQNAGWKLYTNADNTVYQARLTVENVGVATMSFGFDPETNSGTIVVNGVYEPIPGTVFPSKEIAKMLGSFVTDTVPVYQGEATGYSAYRKGTNYYIRIEIEEGTEPSAREAYIHTILQNGYDLETGFTYTYVSPNRQIYLQASGVENSGTLIITVWHVLEETETWPAEKIAAIFGEDVVDVLPEYDDGFIYELSPEGNGELNIWITLPDDVTGEDAVEAYQTILLQNGYAHAYDDADEDGHYVTENAQLDVCAWTYGDDLNLYICFPETASEWPEDFIEYIFGEYDFDDELPAYEGEFNRVNYGTFAGIAYVNVRLEEPTPANIVEAFDGYCETVDEAGFVFVKEDLVYGDQIYNSPNEEYSITISPRTYGFRIEIGEPASVETSDAFPMEEIIECVPEAENVLPIIASAEGIAFHTEGGVPGYIDVYAVYDDTDALEDAYNAYISALKDASFVEGDYYGDTVYYSPNHDFYAMVDYDAEYGLWIGVGSVAQ